MIGTFIIRVTYFALPALLTACLGDIILSNALKKSKTYAAGEYSTWNDIYDGKINSDIVIYGSSRAVVQIDPGVIEDSLHRSCYNLGIDGHNFWLQHFRHREFFKYNRRPNTIIHSLDVTTLTDRGALFNAEQFLPFMLFNKAIQSNTAHYNFFSAWDFHVPMIRYLGKGREMFHAGGLLLKNQADSLGRIKGYMAQRRTWNDDLENARKKLPSYYVTVDNNALLLFKEYLQECKDQDIAVILVYTPQYIEGQQFVKNKESILDIYRSLSSEYGVPFLDYSDDPICQSSSYFYNSGHLNKEGSALFTRKLSRDVGEWLSVNR